jgi:hypothetical protein
MAAGLGFKDFQTGEVLTAADVDGYLMQGIWVFASTAARDAAVTSPQEGNFAFTKDTNGLWYYDGAAWVASGATGDIEGVTAGIGISGGGTSGTVTVTNSMATAIDAKGDLVAGTGADTFAKLTVGANNTVLTADSSESTGLKWATPASGGGLTLLSTTSLSGATTSITSISGSYINLLIQIIDGVKSGVGGVTLQFNSDTGSNYADGKVQVENSTAYPATNNTATSIDIGACGTATAQLSKQAQDIMITNYVSTGTKTLSFTGNVKYASGAINFFTGSGLYIGGSAISSIQVNAGGGGYTGGEIKIWGMK